MDMQKPLDKKIKYGLWIAFGYVCGVLLILAPIHEFGHWAIGNLIGYRTYFYGWTYVSHDGYPDTPWQGYVEMGAGPTFEIVAYLVISALLAWKRKYGGAFFFLGQQLYFPIRFFHDDEWYFLYAYGKALIPASIVFAVIMCVVIWANMEQDKVRAAKLAREKARKQKTNERPLVKERALR
ncbi:hypothetical protein Spirs_2801 [Sediminispirochaeta smaragdinae DSM 11293]|uniref:Uncharacterized protein n=2 Tax=Sediminispirochaeta TaxID=1911556 RepID=E1R219_SEDSS|nr:hypothetical protein Spirs_2801 [Sediminispirochaeta smaragdinae DSM 11293]